jgi:L-malate glycosyltransferase
MKPLKILYMMDAMHGGERVGGTEGQLLELLTHLDRDRFDPRLALFRSTPYIEDARTFPCPVDVLDIGSLSTARSALKLLGLSARLRRHGYGVVHIFLNDAAIAAPMFCRIGGASVIVSRRDMGFWYTEPILRALRVSNRFVSRVIANSDAVRRNVHDREGFPLTAIDVLYNGHDPRKFDVEPLPGFHERLGIAPADPVIGMVANFNPWKRHVDLVEAFAIVRQQHPRAHLVLVGSGAMSPAMEAVRARGLESAVHFYGGVDNAIPVRKHFSVGVLSSESEGLSNAVIEYMGCGKPTVCTNVGGNPEAITDGETGFLVPPFAVATLADRINTLLTSPVLREQMGRRAHDAARRFTSRYMADAHMALYQRIATNS